MHNCHVLFTSIDCASFVRALNFNTEQHGYTLTHKAEIPGDHVAMRSLWGDILESWTAYESNGTRYLLMAADILHFDDFINVVLRFGVLLKSGLCFIQLGINCWLREMKRFFAFARLILRIQSILWRFQVTERTIKTRLQLLADGI